MHENEIKGPLLLIHDVLSMLSNCRVFFFFYDWKKNNKALNTPSPIAREFQETSQLSPTAPGDERV